MPDTTTTPELSPYLDNPDTVSARVVYEQSIIGSVLLDPEVVYEALPLDVDDFLVPFHKRIWKTILSIHNEGKPISLVSIATNSGLMDMPVAYKQYLVNLTELIPGAAHVSYFANELRQCSLVSKLKDRARDMIDQNNPEEVLVLARRLTEEASSLNASRTRTFAEVLEETMMDIGDKAAGKVPKPIPTGFPSLDRANTFVPGDLVVIGAGTSVGKTIMGFQIASKAASSQRTTLFVPLEMTANQLAKRSLSAFSAVKPSVINLASLTEEEWERMLAAQTRLSEWPLHLMDMDQSPITLDGVIGTARMMKKTHDLEMVVIDYLQLLPTPLTEKGRMNISDELSGIMRKLKMLALELKIVIVVLSQINRAGDSAERPRLHNLRGSGAIEHTGDTVFFLHPDMGDSDFDTWKEAPVRGLILAVEKNRNGPRFDTKIVFKSETLTMKESI